VEKYDLNDVVFVNSGSRLGKYCSVNASGNIYFTSDNAKPLKLEKAGQVLVGYNEKTREIVLKPCDPE
jgi:hypothetical protein